MSGPTSRRDQGERVTCSQEQSLQTSLGGVVCKAVLGHEAMRETGGTFVRGTLNMT